MAVAAGATRSADAVAAIGLVSIVAVTVAAWQWGRAGAAPVKTEVVEQTFNLVAE